MMNKKYKREYKESQPVLAICYDFDRTLSPDDMQAQGYIQSVGYDVGSFWKESNGLAEANDMDRNLVYMYLMKETAAGKVLFTKEKLEDYGSKVDIFPGVEDWFERIRNYGTQQGVIVEHYIISSGLKEMIEGTSVAKKGAFKKIYASSFYYNADGVAVWPAQVVNYTNKTQFLFRIEKGVLDINDDGVNDSFPPDELRIPFRNMIYIGDSDTDVPCMKLVSSHGGYSIGVYSEKSEDPAKDKAKVYKMMRDNRIRYFAPADYSDGSDLDMLVKTIIDRTVKNEAIESTYFACRKEQIEEDKKSTEEGKEKRDLILQLEESRSFATTHAIIDKLRRITSWTQDECDDLIDIAIQNSQVYYILNDSDVRRLYEKILKVNSTLSENAQMVKKLLEK